MAKKKTDPAQNTDEKYITLLSSASARFDVRRSVFIGSAAPAQTEEAAKAFISSVRSEYPDAAHHCLAYLLKNGGVARTSDDGEPQGTGGIPILNAIKNYGVCDACVVVTRYFGGILLGTGGLIRAYANGARIAMEAAEIVTYELFSEFEIVCTYAQHRKLEHELSDLGVVCYESRFDADVHISCAVYEKETPLFLRRISDIGGGNICVRKTGQRFDIRK